MKKSLFFILFLFSCSMIGGTHVEASTTDVKAELQDLARGWEAYENNKAYNFVTNFVPSDSLQIQKYEIWPSQYINVGLEPVITGDKRLSNYSVINSWASLASSPTETSGQPLYAGRNILDNSNGSTEQELLTPEYNYTYSETTTNTITNGLKLGIKTSATMKFPIASGSMEATTEYNFSNADTSSKTTSVNYKMPPQKIKVPAGKTYRVMTYLSNGKIEGKSDLYAEVAGVVWGTFPEYFKGKGENVGDVLQNSIQNNWGREQFSNLKASGSNVIFKGTGTFSSNYGTDFNIKVEDITPTKTRSDSPRLVKEINVPLIRTVN